MFVFLLRGACAVLEDCRIQVILYINRDTSFTISVPVTPEAYSTMYTMMGLFKSQTKSRAPGDNWASAVPQAEPAGTVD